VRRHLRRLAPLALLAAAAPWTLALLIVQHLAHEHEGTVLPVGVEWSHGHAHEAGTPDHDHPVMAEHATAPARVAMLGLTLASTAVEGFEAMSRSHAETARPTARARNGPLRTAETVAILRV
jgi:hypothetical protein